MRIILPLRRLLSGLFRVRLRHLLPSRDRFLLGALVFAPSVWAAVASATDATSGDVGTGAFGSAALLRGLVGALWPAILGGALTVGGAGLLLWRGQAVGQAQLAALQETVTADRAAAKDRGTAMCDRIAGLGAVVREVRGDVSAMREVLGVVTTGLDAQGARIERIEAHEDARALAGGAKGSA